MKINYLSIFLAGSMLFAAACGSSKKTTDVKAKGKKITPTEVKKETPKTEKSMVNYREGDKLSPMLEVAKQENKPIFMDFYTTWCAPCRMMDESLFADSEVTDFLNKNFVCLKIDAEKGNGPMLREMFEVTGFPTFVFTDANGNVIKTHRGTSSIEDFKKMARTALWKFKNPN